MATNKDTVVATLRYVADWLDSTERDMFRDTADKVEFGDLTDICCPMCEEVDCDEDCPIREDRTRAIDEDMKANPAAWQGPNPNRRKA